MNTGEVRSAKGREKWRCVLEHLIAGTEGNKSGRFVPGFGEFFIDKLDVPHVEAWREGMGTLIRGGDYSPTTVNGWLAVLRVIMKAAKREFRLAYLATEDVKNFDTSELETYTEEEPNTLLPEEVPVFLDAMRRLYPQHTPWSTSVSSQACAPRRCDRCAEREPSPMCSGTAAACSFVARRPWTTR